MASMRLTTPVHLGATSFSGRSVASSQPVASPSSVGVRSVVTMKAIEGKVISTSMDKTIVISVTKSVAHPVYGKRMTRTSKFVAHDNVGCNLGDVVEIVDCPPMSKRKRHTVTKVLQASA